MARTTAHRNKRTAIGRSNNSRPKSKNRRKNKKRYRGQGR